MAGVMLCLKNGIFGKFPFPGSLEIDEPRKMESLDGSDLGLSELQHHTLKVRKGG
jgi:hypothetical protein